MIGPANSANPMNLDRKSPQPKRANKGDSCPHTFLKNLFFFHLPFNFLYNLNNNLFFMGFMT